MHCICGIDVFSEESMGSDLAPVTEDEEDENKERHCDSLIMCIVTTLNEGLRNGGGIGDVLRKPSTSVSKTSKVPLMGCQAGKNCFIPLCSEV